MAHKYFLILFICYLPVYLTLLFYLKTKKEGYTMRAHMVSYLATCDEPWRSVFNVSTVLYGGLSLVVPLTMTSTLGTNRLVSLGAASLVGAGTATILIGFFPMDRKLKIHNVIGFFAFLSVLMTSIVFSIIFYRGLLFSPFMELINSAVVGITFLLGISLLFRREESSLLEWIAVLFTIAWNFLLAVSLLTQVH